MKTLLTAVCIIVAGILVGCATQTVLDEEDTKNKIYCGTIRHFDTTGWYDTIYDLPFSFVADTLLLPYTIPKTIINYQSQEEEEQQTASFEKDTTDKIQ